MGEWRGPPHDTIARCGAKTRVGHPCGLMAMKNGRCRLHGGQSTGARNPHRPLKHGAYTKKALEERRVLSQLLRDAKELIEEIS